MQPFYKAVTPLAGAPYAMYTLCPFQASNGLVVQMDPGEAELIGNIKVQSRAIDSVRWDPFGDTQRWIDQNYAAVPTNTPFLWKTTGLAFDRQYPPGTVTQDVGSWYWHDRLNVPDATAPFFVLNPYATFPTAARRVNIVCVYICVSLVYICRSVVANHVECGVLSVLDGGFE